MNIHVHMLITVCVYIALYIYICMYVCMDVCMQSYMFGLDMAVSFQSLWGFTLGNHQARGGIWSLRQSYDVGAVLKLWALLRT